MYINNSDDQKDPVEMGKLSQDEIEVIFNKQILHAMINGLPGVFFLDNEHRILRWNQSYQDALGYSNEDLYQQDVLQMIAEEDRVTILDSIRRTFEQGSSTVEAHIISKAGKKVLFFLSSMRVVIDGAELLLGTGLNIQKFKDDEKALKRRNKELETIVSVSRAMRVTKNLAEFHRVVLDQITELFKINSAAMACYDPIKNQDRVVFGIGEWENWMGHYLSPEMKSYGQIDSSRLNGENSNIETPLSLTSPAMFGSLTTVVNIPLVASGESLGSLWVGRYSPFTQVELELLIAIADMAVNAIHRQKLFESMQEQLVVLNNTRSQLVQSEKLAAIGELVAGVAHELNNPLTSIILYARMIQQNYNDEVLNKDIEIVVKESQRAAKIVHGLLDFSRQHPVEKKPTQVNDILNTCLTVLSPELISHHMTWSLQLDQNLPIILADPSQLQQVFIIIINNAWQAISNSENDGHLLISTQLKPSFFAAEHAAPEIMSITFRNDGPKIADTDLPYLFNPFFTTKTDGTGLGLSVCHGIVTEHGGHIWAENNVDEGVTFYLELPVILPVESDKKSEKPVENLPDIATVKSKILVVDDELSILEIVSRLLKRRGYEVDTASDGDTAMSMLLNQQYDLILCDIKMPGLSGPDLYSQLEQKHIGMENRIIFTTGDVTSPKTRQFFEKTGVPYLSKPFELDQLLAKIRPVLSPIQA